jgi:predicted nuclease of predicted toxin-antitoxin system
LAESKRKARFFVDESLGEGTVDALRDLKWNSSGVWDAGLVGRSDEDVFAFARKDCRILLSHDTDFLDDRRFPIHPQPGIVILPGGDGDTAALLEALGHIVTLFVTIPTLCQDSKVHARKGQVFELKSREHATGRITSTRYMLSDPGHAYLWKESG